MPVAPDPPDRPKDLFSAVVKEWQGGCLLCDAPVTDRLPSGLMGTGFPLCERHVRWALASRRERMGRQAGRLKWFLLAWCQRERLDPGPVREWLGY